MRAAIWTRYGPPEVLEVHDIATPRPGDNEILVRVRAANVFPGDAELRGFQIHLLYWLPLRLYIGVTRPRVKVLGQEFSGEVVAVGRNVTGFEAGDAVFSPTALGGAYAEYVALRPRVAAIKPANISFEEAATVSVSGLNALHFLRVGKVQAGQKILIYGAAGCIGTMAVQLGKVMGANVTAVDSTAKLAVLRDIGADTAIDYTEEDFAERGDVYDVAIDLVGKSDFWRTIGCIKPGGYYVHGNASTATMARRLWAPLVSGRKVRIALTSYRREDLLYLARLLEARRIKPVIDRQFSLEEIVEAHRYVDSGKKTGNVVISFPESAAEPQ
jgi:NADPH:quinone reductase-like Zn-dependent oxidoreductase